MMDRADDLETELIDPKVQESLKKGPKMRLPRITRYFYDKINGMTLEQALDRHPISVQEVGDIYLTYNEFTKEFSRSRMDDIGFREAGDKFTAI